MRHRIAFLIAALSFASTSGLAAQPSNRPLVLLVHGRGQTARDTASLRRDALSALRAGARDIAGDSLLRDDDLRLVFYADVLSSGIDHLDAKTSSACDARLAESDPAGSVGSVFTLFAAIAGALVDAGGAESSADDRDGLRSLAGDLRYLGDQRMRCAAELRLGAALLQARAEGRPVVLVAHSLGALVSWGHLHARAPRAGESLPEVERLITMGSPLGSPDIRQLIFGADTTRVTLPKSVKSWVNVVNPEDPFAVRLSLGDDSAIAGIRDALTSRGAVDPHEMRSYLADPVTQRAVLGAWCQANVDRPRSCAALER